MGQHKREPVAKCHRLSIFGSSPQVWRALAVPYLALAVTTRWNELDISIAQNKALGDILILTAPL